MSGCCNLSSFSLVCSEASHSPSSLHCPITSGPGAAPISSLSSPGTPALWLLLLIRNAVTQVKVPGHLVYCAMSLLRLFAPFVSKNLESWYNVFDFIKDKEGGRRGSKPISLVLLEE